MEKVNSETGWQKKIWLDGGRCLAVARPWGGQRNEKRLWNIRGESKRNGSALLHQRVWRCSETKVATPPGLKSEINKLTATFILKSFALYLFRHLFSVMCVARFYLKDENNVEMFCFFFLQARPGGRHHVEILRRSWISILRRVLQVREDGQNWTRNIWVWMHHITQSVVFICQPFGLRVVFVWRR